MNDSLIIAFATIAGTIVGGGVTYFTNRQTLNRQDLRRREEVRLERLDRLHQSLNKLDLYIAHLFLELHASFYEKKKFDVSSIPDDYISDVEFLTHAFMPAAASSLDGLRIELNELEQMIHVAREDNRSDETNNRSLTEVFHLQKRTEKFMRAVRNELYGSARKITAS